MKWSLAAGLLLLFSLTLKLNTDSGDPTDNARDVSYRAAERLSQQGYQARIRPGGLQIVARKGQCALAARMIDAHGTQLTFIKAALGQTGELRYAWRGTWHSSSPRLRQLLQFYLSREAARLRFAARRDPVWVVAVPRGCPAPQPDFAAEELTLTMAPPANRLRQ